MVAPQPGGRRRGPVPRPSPGPGPLVRRPHVGPHLRHHPPHGDLGPRPRHRDGPGAGGGRHRPPAPHRLAGLEDAALRLRPGGEEYPAPIRVELVGPGYARWVFGPEESDQVVRGQAADWCRLVVTRLPPAQAGNLTAVGEVAATALRVARAHV